jgi:hypothetical protein
MIDRQEVVAVSGGASRRHSLHPHPVVVRGQTESQASNDLDSNKKRMFTSAQRLLPGMMRDQTLLAAQHALTVTHTKLNVIADRSGTVCFVFRIQRGGGAGGGGCRPAGPGLESAPPSAPACASPSRKIELGFRFGFTAVVMMSHKPPPS